MKKYLISETLKTKRTMLRKLTIFIPILSVALASIFGYLGGDIKSADITSINHWSLLWLPALISLLTGMFHKLEQNSTGYKTIFSFPINLRKSWISKIILLSLFTLVSSIFLGILILILNFTIIKASTNGILIMGQHLSIVSFYNYFIAIIISWLVSLWQIPLCLWLSKKINFFVLLFITCAANLELGAGKAASSLWWMNPWTWPLRLQCPLLHLHPNCLPLESNSALLNSEVIPIGILLGVFLFLILTFLTSFSFRRSEVH